MNILMNTPSARPSKTEPGEAYGDQLIVLLAATGYATVRQIAKHIWGRCDDSARKMAGRKLRQLLKDKLIVCKRDGGAKKVSNEMLYALSSAGAKRARAVGDPLVAEKVHARDYLRHAHAHRTACNSVYCAWPIDVAIWSELEVRSKVSPIHEYSYCFQTDPFAAGKAESKIPDLIADAGNGRFEWIEVENSWRSEKDLIKMIQCMQMMFLQDRRFECVHFIVTTPVAKTLGKRLKQRLTFVPGSGERRAIKEISARILAKHIRISILDPFTLTLTRVPIE